MGRRDEIIVGLDIGTTKIACIIGEVTDEGLDIIGIGSHPSTGLRKGVVINIDATINSIAKAVEEAELMAGCEVNRVYAGIAGGHVKGFNSRGIVAVKDKEVRRQDLARVVDAARAVAMPMDRKVIHVIPQEYIIDDQDGIKEPLGMTGVRLEANVHIVTASVTSAQNIVKCANACGLEVADIVLEQLASSEAVLSEDEKELGVAVVDVGGGTTDIAIYSQGSLVHTAVLSIGGNHLTNDIAVGLRTPMAEAERIKQKYGCAMTDKISPEETIEVPSVGGRPPRVLSRQILSEIIEPRVEEIFAYVGRELKNSGYEDLIASGVVITGGTTILENMPELAEEVLGLPVRRGVPKGVGGLVDVVRNPKFATGVGLVLHGSCQPERAVFSAEEPGFYRRFASRVGQWFAEMF
ncbi:cell division protein FtsA [Persicimonas caeni]|uniref:Cell division protein FtsA n=1 Tax=Persicimonas caeni TaxID=2292766 RepID=A0A4Y6Q2E6_PERCE|nr:cell division protein FtsA [Persicimonas caeni]QDG54768.1 cell division protein FtsA [Persicimonas caeni]QED35989.1 cell division protein FtsA [Persicimonas caeni]